MLWPYLFLCQLKSVNWRMVCQRNRNGIKSASSHWRKDGVAHGWLGVCSQFVLGFFIKQNTSTVKWLCWTLDYGAALIVQAFCNRLITYSRRHTARTSGSLWIVVGSGRWYWWHQERSKSKDSGRPIVFHGCVFCQTCFSWIFATQILLYSFFFLLYNLKSH